MTRRGKRGSPLVPERIGRYEVLLPIASGGMGTVYLARSRGLGGFQREVALKVMHAHLREEEHFSTDLIEEAKLAVRIQHPNVVQVLDVGDDPHGVFLVMEYVEGDSLAGLMRARRKHEATVPAPIGIRILLDALLGLHAAHELSDESGAPLCLVHRDFSPQNILVGVDGSSKLTDFGVAKATTRLSHTATGLVKGKIHYMSPEQARTEPIDRRCDVWAGGVMAWETLAGRRLYKDRNDASILLKLITEPPPRLRTVMRDIPQPLEDVVAHALAMDVRKRCPTAKRFAEELERAAAASVGVASMDEVAAFLHATSGESLKKRREQVSEVLKLRSELNEIARESTIDTLELTTSPLDTRGVRDATGETSVGELRDLGPGQREEEQTQVTHSTQTTRDARTSATRSRLALGATALLLAVGVGYAFTRPPGDAAARADVAAAGPADTSPGASSLAPADGAAAPATTADASPEPPSDAPATGLVRIDVQANAPLVAVQVGPKTLTVTPPNARVQLELEEATSAAAQPVVATAADGRVARVTLAARGTSVAIQFPPRSAAPSPRPLPRPTAAPLATNPHQ